MYQTIDDNGLIHVGQDKPHRGKEDGLQIACTLLVQYKYPGIEYFHVPNGGSRHIAEAAKLRRMGVKAGVADCLILTPSGSYGAALIELKAKGGKLSAHQIKHLQKMQQLGYYVRVAWNLAAFETCLKEYFNAK